MSVDNKLITVFTPTFNRAYTLSKCYESLKRQTKKDFHWLIIDDGSSDDTRELVKHWIKENNDFTIEYIYQENQGMHGAHNTAYANIKTELNVCIDSDDYLTDYAIETIISFWEKNRDIGLAGIVALDGFSETKVLGDKFPTDVDKLTYWDIYHKYHLKGDKKLIYRTDLIRENPYPRFEGEKYVGLAYKYAKLDADYQLAVLNEIVCIVEYMEDGSSRNMLRQYRSNPMGFKFIRIENMKNPRATTKFKFKTCIHYVSSCLLLKEKNFIMNSPLKGLTLLAFPFGYALYRYILKNT